MAEAPSGQWRTVAEAAEIIRMGQDWVRARIRDRSLPAKRIHDAGNGEYRIHDDAIRAFMESLPDA